MTTIVKWAPFQDLDVVERRMRRMLEDWGVAPATLLGTEVGVKPHRHRSAHGLVARDELEDVGALLRGRRRPCRSRTRRPQPKRLPNRPYR